MKLSASTLAWPSSDDSDAAAMLRAAGCDGVEVAPTRWRERPLEASAAEVASYREWWESRGLRIVALQSLLFGRPDLQLFGNAASRAALDEHLCGMISLGRSLGAHVLVFGSPKNRLRGELPLASAMSIACDFFQRAGDAAASHGLSLCIEANPAAYGCDFVTTTAEAVALCRRVNHPAIRVNGDLGGMTIAGENPARALEDAGQWIGHFHASEPQLAELGTAGADHASAARGLTAIGYDGWVTIEMRDAIDTGNLSSVERAAARAKAAYGIEGRSSAPPL